MIDPLWLVTVMLRDKYFTTQWAVRAPTEGDAKESVATQLETLRKYVPAADLVIKGVRKA